MGITGVCSCLYLDAQVQLVVIGAATSSLLCLVAGSLEGSLSAGAGVLLVGQQGFPFGFCDRLHLVLVSFKPVSVVALFFAEGSDGQGVDGIAQRAPPGIDVTVGSGGGIHPLSEGVAEEEGLCWVFRATGVDARCTVGLGAVDLGCQPHFAGH